MEIHRPFHVFHCTCMSQYYEGLVKFVWQSIRSNPMMMIRTKLNLCWSKETCSLPVSPQENSECRRKFKKAWPHGVLWWSRSLILSLNGDFLGTVQPLPACVSRTWASRQRYMTGSQTTSDYITKSTRPSQFFSHMLRNMGRPGYEATIIYRPFA